MKRILYLFIAITLFFSGCSALPIVEPKSHLYVYEYDANTIFLKRNIKNNMSLWITIDNVLDDRNVDVKLYEGNDLIANNNDNRFFEYQIELENHKKNSYKLIEKVIYYDENHRDNNFAYNKSTEMVVYFVNNNINKVSVSTSKEMNWNVKTNVLALFNIKRTGIYNPNIIFYNYTYLNIIISTLLLYIIFTNLKKYAILRERQKLDNILIASIVVSYVGILMFDNKKIDAMFKTVFNLFLLLCIVRFYFKNKKYQKSLEKRDN